MINNWLRGFMATIVTVKDLVRFLWMRKLWWLIPMVIVLLIFGLFVILASTSAISPFIYTLF
jgi:hypothetical protein